MSSLLSRLRWGSLNVNEQCYHCRGRLKLRPCGICGNLFCMGCYETRWYRGFVVKICKKCMAEFTEKTGQGKAIRADRRHFRRNFF